jgi:hypothetical protein
MRISLIPQNSIGSESNEYKGVLRIKEVGCVSQLTSGAIERSTKEYPQAAGGRRCGSLQCAFLELFHNRRHSNSGTIDISAPVSSASSDNDLQ